MTDAGGFDLDDGLSHAAERERLLRQIAQMLGVPLSVFRQDRCAGAARNRASSEECVTMLAMFSRIHDPALRRQCLALVESCVDA